jgi:hypothetical protein
MTHRDGLDRDRLRELLRDARCPYGIRTGRGQATRLIGLPDLLEFVESQVGPQPGLEQHLDSLMTAVSCERLALTDPWTAPERMLRRLRGRRNVRAVAYAVPIEAMRE